MNKDFVLPDIGEGIVECQILEWKVKEGDLIEEDQVVADVSTDKAIVEIPSVYSGRVTKLHTAVVMSRQFTRCCFQLKQMMSLQKMKNHRLKSCPLRPLNLLKVSRPLNQNNLF